MSTQSDIDAAVATLKTASQVHIAAGRPAHVLADWLESQICQFDDGIHRRLIQRGNAVINGAPDRRTFVSADNVAVGS